MLSFLGQASEVWKDFLTDLLEIVKNLSSDFWESVMGLFSPLKNFILSLILLWFLASFLCLYLGSWALQHLGSPNLGRPFSSHELYWDRAEFWRLSCGTFLHATGSSRGTSSFDFSSTWCISSTGYFLLTLWGLFLTKSRFLFWNTTSCRSTSTSVRAEDKWVFF